MSRNEALYLEDIQESCEKVLRFTEGMTFKEFVHDDLHFALSCETWRSLVKQ